MNKERQRKSQTLREYLNKFNKIKRIKSNENLNLTSFKEQSYQPSSESLVLGKLEMIRQIIIGKAAFSKEDSDILGYLSDIVNILNSVFEKLKDSETTESSRKMRIDLFKYEESMKQNTVGKLKEPVSLKNKQYERLLSPQILKKNSQFTDLGGSIRPSQYQIQSKYGQNMDENAYYLPSFPLIQEERRKQRKKPKERLSHQTHKKTLVTEQYFSDLKLNAKSRTQIHL